MHIRQLRGWLMRLFGLFHRARREREFAEELESHLALHIEDNLRAGMSPEEARRQAQLKLGGVTQAQELHREQRGLPMLETLIQDLRFGVRMLARRPGFTVVAVLSLALGIGANTAIFSLINMLLLRPLPIRQPGQLVALNNAGANRSLFSNFSYPNYEDLRARNDVFTDLFAYRITPLSISHDGINERRWGYEVSGNYFVALGVQPALGRFISADDDRTPGAHPVVVIGHRYWQQSLGGAPDAVGKEVIVNGRRYTIIGVTPPGFLGTEIASAAEFWFPLAMLAQLEVGNNGLNERGAEIVFVQGRLKPEVSAAQAQTVFLEVRPSNLPALRLYQTAGFCEVGLRRGYYPAATGREDALVMAREL